MGVRISFVKVRNVQFHQTGILVVHQVVGTDVSQAPRSEKRVFEAKNGLRGPVTTLTWFYGRAMLC